jgi:hypothetical protein
MVESSLHRIVSPRDERVKSIIDPRNGDIEDDASSTKRRSLYAIAGTLLAEISFAKLAAAWISLIAIPGILLGLTPLVASGWLAVTSRKLAFPYPGMLPAIVLFAVFGLGWLGSRPLFRMAERSFWSLNALAVQPAYILCREGLRHLADVVFPSLPATRRRAITGIATALGAGLLLCGLGLLVVALAWPASRWVGDVQDLSSPHRLLLPALANSVVVIAGYLAVVAMIWGVADAAMAQPRDLVVFDEVPGEARRWRVAHLSDLHVVGEQYGFRLESGRSGPRGNGRLRRVLRQLDRIHAENPIDLVLVTGDMTDAGRSAEWAEFIDAMSLYPSLLKRTLILPGNHDVNVVDRANPARFDLPTSPKKRLRQMRALSAIAAVQGDRVRVIDQKGHRLGGTLSAAVDPHRNAMVRLGNDGTRGFSTALGELWAEVFPMVLVPDTDDGLGVILLDSNSDTHFSFTNALGMISVAQARGMETATGQFPRARWIVALHHHLVEYPLAAKSFSERIGTALVNGSWFVRQFHKLSRRVIVMHGHRHVDWIGDCGGLRIVSAPSPIMESTDEHATWFYIHTLAAGTDGQRLSLLAPTLIEVEGQTVCAE